MLNSLFFLLEGEGADSAAGSGGGNWITFVMLAAVVVFFYFFLIRPQKKQEKEATNMRNSLEVGDEVVTIGGIIGQIVSIKGETVTIVTSKNKTKIRFLKTAIRNVDAKANGEATGEKATAPESELPSVETVEPTEPSEQ